MPDTKTSRARPRRRHLLVRSTIAIEYRDRPSTIASDHHRRHASINHQAATIKQQSASIEYSSVGHAGVLSPRLFPVSYFSRAGIFYRAFLLREFVSRRRFSRPCSASLPSSRVCHHRPAGAFPGRRALCYAMAGADGFCAIGDSDGDDLGLIRMEGDISIFCFRRRPFSRAAGCVLRLSCCALAVRRLRNRDSYLLIKTVVEGRPVDWKSLGWLVGDVVGVLVPPSPPPFSRPPDFGLHRPCCAPLDA